jgi:DNA repair protein RecO (recombination protein O)
MSLEKTEAVILKLFNWSESSRTVVFFSRGYGKLALVDKAGRSFTSKRGRLIPGSRMEITYYSSEKEGPGYISDVELLEHFSLEKEGTVGRLAFTSAAAELLYLLMPEKQAQTDLYDYFLSFLRYMDSADRPYLPAIFLAFYLRLLSQLGYSPSLAWCSLCRKELPGSAGEGEGLLFSPERGGIVCSSCQRPGDAYIPLSMENHRLMVTLQTASLKEAATLPVSYQETVRLAEALTRFVSYQAGITSGLKSLEFLEKLKNSDSLK